MTPIIPSARPSARHGPAPCGRGALFFCPVPQTVVCSKEETPMETAPTLDAELDRLISRRAGADHETIAEERARLWRDSLGRHKAAIRERNRWEWIRYFDRMAASHAALAKDYERRAEELCEEGAV